MGKCLLSTGRFGASLQRLDVGEADVAYKMEGRRFARTDNFAAGNGGRAGQPRPGIGQMLVAIRFGERRGVGRLRIKNE